MERWKDGKKEKKQWRGRSERKEGRESVEGFARKEKEGRVIRLYLWRLIREKWEDFLAANQMRAFRCLEQFSRFSSNHHETDFPRFGSVPTRKIQRHVGGTMWLILRCQKPLCSSPAMKEEKEKEKEKIFCGWILRKATGKSAHF